MALQDTLQSAATAATAASTSFYRDAIDWLARHWELVGEALSDQATALMDRVEKGKEEEEDKKGENKPLTLLGLARQALIHALQLRKPSRITEQQCSLAHSLLHIDRAIVQYREQSHSHKKEEEEEGMSTFALADSGGGTNNTRISVGSRDRGDDDGGDDAGATMISDFSDWIWRPYEEQQRVRKLAKRTKGVNVKRALALSELACVLTSLEYAWRSNLTAVLHGPEALAMAKPREEVIGQWCWFGRHLQRLHAEYESLGGDPKLLPPSVQAAYHFTQSDPAFQSQCGPSLATMMEEGED
jgi:hypothetical protein